MKTMAMLVLGLLLVLQLGVNAETTVSSDKIVAAINKKDYDKFVTVLTLSTQENVDPNQPDSKGKLPMVEAARTRDLRFVDSLLQYGAFVRVSDMATGATPLHAAIQTGSVEVVRVLLSYGASPDTPDRAGKSPRQSIGNQRAVRELVDKFDAAGAAAFEDAPGTWTRASKPATPEDEYWFNPNSNEARWNTPPSCGWQRVDVQGHPGKYINAVTSQETSRIPAALSWRLVHLGGTDDVWYNWATNATQFEEPQEIPGNIFKELLAQKNVRWYNDKTQEFAWEDPMYHTHWRAIQEPGADKPYYYNIETAQSQWEVPDQLAWNKMESEEHPGSYYFWNSKTGESSWESPAHMSWARHDTDL